jgi:hypothetical protein
MASAVPISGEVSRTVRVLHPAPSNRTTQRREPDVNDKLMVCCKVAGSGIDRAIDCPADGDATTIETAARLHTRPEVKRQ